MKPSSSHSQPSDSTSLFHFSDRTQMSVLAGSVLAAIALLEPAHDAAGVIPFTAAPDAKPDLQTVKAINTNLNLTVSPTSPEVIENLQRVQPEFIEIHQKGEARKFTDIQHYWAHLPQPWTRAEAAVLVHQITATSPEAKPVHSAPQLLEPIAQAASAQMVNFAQEISIPESSPAIPIPISDPGSSPTSPELSPPVLDTQSTELTPQPLPQLPPPPAAATLELPQLDPIPTSDDPQALLTYWQALCQANESDHANLLAACNQVLAITPTDAQAWATRGNALFRLGRYSESVASFERSMAIAPTVSSVWVDHCRALSALGEQTAAIASCSKALELDENWNDSSQAIAWYHWGTALKRLGQNEEANQIFDRAVATDPTYSLAWAEKCRVLSELGQQEAAIAACDRALQVNGNWGDRTTAVAWQNRALALTRSERYEEAIAAYNQALAINPNDATSWTTQGILLSKLGRYTEALTSQTWAVKVSPNYAVALVNRCAVLNKLGQYEAALEDCEKALNADGQWNLEGPAQAWNQQGQALAGLDRLDDALASANRATGIKPDYPEAWNNRAVILWRMKQYVDALDSVEQALQIKPDYTQGWFNKGRILRSLERYEQAIAAYDRAIQTDASLSDRPTLADIWSNRAVVLWRIGNQQEALVSTNQAVHIAPTDPQAWYNHAVVLTALQHYDEALLSYEQAIRYDNTNAYAWAGKGVVLERLNRTTEAIASFTQALSLDPNQPIAQQRVPATPPVSEALLQE